MPRIAPLQGDLQQQVMQALWRLGGGSVEEVRSAMPARYRSAYNTVQTVLNRLAERGLASRARVGKTIEYRPTLSEAEYLAGSIRHTFVTASSDARRAALAELIGDLDPDELADLRSRAESIEQRRRRRER